MNPETPKPPQEMITSVPGMEPIDIPAPSEVVKLVEFRGDPRRVIGHPSNPASEMSAAYTNRLRDNAEAAVTSQQIEESTVATEALKGLITEMPK